MRVSFLLPLTLLAAALPTAFACTFTQDCCWGGADNGFLGCKGQHRLSRNKCKKAKYWVDWCMNRSVTVQDCQTDCCTISTKEPRECPSGGKIKHGGIGEPLFGGDGPDGW